MLIVNQWWMALAHKVRDFVAEAEDGQLVMRPHQPAMPPPSIGATKKRQRWGIDDINSELRSLRGQHYMEYNEGICIELEDVEPTTADLGVLAQISSDVLEGDDLG